MPLPVWMRGWVDGWMGGCAAWHVVIGGVWLPLQAGKRKGFNPPPPLLAAGWQTVGRHSA